MNYADMMLRGRCLLDAHGLRDWRFDVQNLRNMNLYVHDYYGICFLETKTIVVDWHSSRNFRQTVLHEIAHALLGRPGHDRDWLRVAAQVGCTFKHLLPYACADKSIVI